MTRFFIFLYLLFFSANTINAQIEFNTHKPQTAAQAQLKGAVHTVKIEEQTMKIVEGKATMSARTSLAEMTYSEAGRMTAVSLYDENGQIRRANRYTYLGRFLQKSAADLYDKGNKLYRKTEYEYDNKGEIKLQVNFDYDDKGKMYRKTVLSRDDKGTIEMKDLKADGSPFKRNLFGTPQSGRAIKKDAPEKRIIELKRRMVYDEIDEQGNWTKKTIFGGTDTSSGNKVETREITYRIITYY